MSPKVQNIELLYFLMSVFAGLYILFIIMLLLLLFDRTSLERGSDSVSFDFMRRSCFTLCRGKNSVRSSIR